MVISPVVRGLFGLAWDAAENKLTVTPRLPPEWDKATLYHVPLGSGTVDLTLSRSGKMLLVRAAGMIRVNDLLVRPHLEGAQATQRTSSSLFPVQVDFVTGEGYVEKTVKFTW